MSRHLPPVPPENRSHAGPGTDRPPRNEKPAARPAEQNFAEEGQQGNIKQNTINQGYQQDR